MKLEKPADRRSPRQLLKFVEDNFNLAGQITNFLRFDMPAPPDPAFEDENYKDLDTALKTMRDASYSAIAAAKRIAGEW